MGDAPEVPYGACREHRAEAARPLRAARALSCKCIREILPSRSSYQPLPRDTELPVTPRQKRPWPLWLARTRGLDLVRSQELRPFAMRIGASPQKKDAARGDEEGQR